MGGPRRAAIFLAMALALVAAFVLPLAAGKIVIDTTDHKTASVDVCIAKSLGTEYLQYYESAKTLSLSSAGTTSSDAIPDVNMQLNAYRQPNLTPETDLRELIKANTLDQAAFTQYAYGLIPFAAPGIALGAISLIFTLFFISECLWGQRVARVSRMLDVSGGSVSTSTCLHSSPVFCATTF